MHMIINILRYISVHFSCHKIIKKFHLVVSGDSFHAEPKQRVSRCAIMKKVSASGSVIVFSSINIDPLRTEDCTRSANTFPSFLKGVFRGSTSGI